MKITESIQQTTVGHLAAFLAHAIANGAPLDAPLEMTHNRRDDVTTITIDLTLPGFGSPAEAAQALGGEAPKVARARRERSVQPGLGAPAAPPSTTAE